MHTTHLVSLSYNFTQRRVFVDLQPFLDQFLCERMSTKETKLYKSQREEKTCEGRLAAGTRLDYLAKVLFIFLQLSLLSLCLLLLFDLTKNVLWKFITQSEGCNVGKSI